MRGLVAIEAVDLHLERCKPDTVVAWKSGGTMRRRNAGRSSFHPVSFTTQVVFGLDKMFAFIIVLACRPKS